MWLTNLFSNVILVIVGMCITNPGYLKNRSLPFTELQDNGTEKSIRIFIGQNTATIIVEIDD